MYKLGQYLPMDSVLHHLDPRVKIASIIALSIIIWTGKAPSLIMISGLLLALLHMARLGPSHILKAIEPILVFLLLLFSLHLLFTDGSPIPPFPVWRVTITYEGLYRGLLISWQFGLLIISAYLLMVATSPSELVMGVERLLRPFKILRVPSHDVAMMISLALRFVPTLLEEMDRTKQAQMARGARFKTGTIAQRMKATACLLMPIIHGTLRRADELATAMEGRGYQRGHRTYMRELSMSRVDYMAMVVICFVLGFHLYQ